jgi:hypothetical protein
MAPAETKSAGVQKKKKKKSAGLEMQTPQSRKLGNKSCVERR